MKIKKLFTYTTIVSGFLLLLLIVLLFINSSVNDCEDNHDYDNETNMCFYAGQDCEENEKKELIDGKYYCTYLPSGFLNTSVMKFILGFIGFGWFVIFIIFIVNTGKTTKPIEVSAFRREEFVSPNKAKTLWALSHSREFGIPIINDEYQKSAFKFYYSGEPYQKGKEWFYKFACEVRGGDYPGVFTVVTSISRGENWILNGGYRWQECSYDDYKIARDMPLHVPEDAQERLIEQLYQSNPERAVELQRQIAERNLIPNVESNESPPPVTQKPKFEYKKPWYKRRYL